MKTIEQKLSEIIDPKIDWKRLYLEAEADVDRLSEVNQQQLDKIHVLEQTIKRLADKAMKG